MSQINNSEENHPYHDTPTSSSSSSFSTSSSCSSPDIQQKEYVLLNNKSRRKKRAFIPDEKKDPIYWSQRSKNNLSAKRSRVKRRMNDLVLETKLTQLTNENEILRAKIDMLTRKFGQEKPTVFNQSVNNPSMTTKTEQLSLPIKLRFKLLSNS